MRESIAEPWGRSHLVPEAVAAVVSAGASHPRQCSRGSSQWDHRPLRLVGPTSQHPPTFAPQKGNMGCCEKVV